MIQIRNYPQPDRFLLDGNNTVVSVTSTNGIGYYFRAEIYIDDVLFDEQSWSREDNFTATKDLIYLYNAYFESVFNEIFATSLTEQTHLIKKVGITIKEYLIEDDSLIETLELTDFYILFNTKSIPFDDTNKITVLGLDASVMRVPATGNIVIPVFVNTDNESVSISATLNDDVVIDGQLIPAFTDKRVYLYTLNLAAENITYYHLYVTIDITVGTTTVSRTYKLIRNPHFPVKELVFKNNFGFYIPAYFDGELETQTGYKVETYEQLNETEVVYNVDTSTKYSINTNGLLDSETPLVNQIAEALICKFKNGSVYETINTKTTKTKDFADKEHHQNTKLAFDFKSKLNQDNVGFLEQPECDDITVDGFENVNLVIAKSVFDTAFSPNTINYIAFTELPASGTLYAVLFGVPLPVSLNVPLDYSIVDSFRFDPLTDEFGTPYTSFKFQVREGIIYSNEATGTINLDDATGEQPPTISTVPSARLRLTDGDGSREIYSVITDPNGNLDTILWEFVGTPYADTVITDETTEAPIITITGGEDGQFNIKCTATDTLTNSSEAIVTIIVSSHITEIESDRMAESGSGSDTDRIYTITLTDGIEGETVDIVFDYDVYETTQYVLVNFGEDTEFMISLLNRKQVFQYTFDENGEIMFHVFMEDNNTTEHATMTLTVTKPTGDVLVSETNGTLEI